MQTCDHCHQGYADCHEVPPKGRLVLDALFTMPPRDGEGGSEVELDICTECEDALLSGGWTAFLRRATITTVIPLFPEAPA